MRARTISRHGWLSARSQVSSLMPSRSQLPTRRTAVGGKPLVQPDGRVIAPFEGIGGSGGIRAFASSRAVTPTIS